MVNDELTKNVRVKLLKVDEVNNLTVFQLQRVGDSASMTMVNIHLPRRSRDFVLQHCCGGSLSGLSLRCMSNL